MSTDATELPTDALILVSYQTNRHAMWDEIADMPGEIFDISDETRDEMAAAWEHNEILNQIADLVFDS